MDLDISKCSACGACAIACMDQNDIDIENGEFPFRFVLDVEQGEKFESLSVSCMHCEDAPCVMSCPTGCLSKDLGTGLTLYDNTWCIGCHSCVMACPLGMPSFTPDNKMRKCDGCVTRMKHGLQPACVQACPSGALTIKTEREVVAERRTKSIQTITRALFK